MFFSHAETKHFIRILALVFAALSILHYQHSIRPRVLTGSARNVEKHLEESLKRYQIFCDKLKKMISEINEEKGISQEQKKEVNMLLRRVEWFATYMEGP